MGKNDGFEGDLLLNLVPDGVDIVVDNGLMASDKLYSTAIILSLFGGNYYDDGKIKNKNTWWGNVLKNTPENEKLISRFYNFIRAMPISVKNISLAEKAAYIDLKWMIAAGISDEINIAISVYEKNKILVNIFLYKEKNIFFNSSYNFIWGL